MQKNVLKNLSHFLDIVEKIYQEEKGIDKKVIIRFDDELINNDNIDVRIRTITGHYLLDAFNSVKDCEVVSLDRIKEVVNYEVFRSYYIKHYSLDAFDSFVRDINLDIEYILNTEIKPSNSFNSLLDDLKSVKYYFDLLVNFNPSINYIYTYCNSIFLYEGNDKTGKTTLINKKLKVPNTASFDFFSKEYGDDLSYMLKKFNVSDNQILNVQNVVNKSVINYNKYLGEKVGLLQDRSIFSTVIYNFLDYVDKVVSTIYKNPFIVDIISNKKEKDVERVYVENVLFYILKHKMFFDNVRYMTLFNYFNLVFNDCFGDGLFIKSITDSFTGKDIDLLYSNVDSINHSYKKLKNIFLKYISYEFKNFYNHESDKFFYDKFKDSVNFNDNVCYFVQSLISSFVTDIHNFSYNVKEFIFSFFDDVNKTLGNENFENISIEIKKELTSLLFNIQEYFIDCVNNLTRIIFVYKKECREFLKTKKFDYNINIVNYLFFRNFCNFLNLSYTSSSIYSNSGNFSGRYLFDKTVVGLIKTFSDKIYSKDSELYDSLDDEIKVFINSLYVDKFDNTVTVNDNYDNSRESVLVRFYKWLNAEKMYDTLTYRFLSLNEDLSIDCLPFGINLIYIKGQEGVVVKNTKYILYEKPQQFIYDLGKVVGKENDSVDCGCSSNSEFGESTDEDDYSETIKVVPSEEKCDCDGDSLDC